jgi:hypothetical protein
VAPDSWDRCPFSQTVADRALVPAVLKNVFDFYLGSPSPRGVPGEGPDCHLPEESKVFGPIPALMQGGSLFCVPDLSAHFLFFGEILKMFDQPGIDRIGLGTPFLGPGGRFWAPGSGFGGGWGPPKNHKK